MLRTKQSLALTASAKALTKYVRLREAMMFAPPIPATGGFPYFNREEDKHGAD